MKVSISVMAVPERRAYVDELLAALGDVPVAYDPDPARPWAASVWPVRRAALELRDPAADYHLVLQDDAILGRRFRSRLDVTLTRADGRPVSLYYRRKRGPDAPDWGEKSYDRFNAAARAGVARRGFVDPVLMFGVAVALPACLIPDVIDACDQLDGVRADDMRMNRYLRSAGIPTFYPLPSLVSHRPGGTGRGGLNTARVAKWFK